MVSSCKAWKQLSIGNIAMHSSDKWNDKKMAHKKLFIVHVLKAVKESDQKHVNELSIVDIKLSWMDMLQWFRELLNTLRAADSIKIEYCWRYIAFLKEQSMKCAYSVTYHGIVWIFFFFLLTLRLVTHNAIMPSFFFVL